MQTTKEYRSPLRKLASFFEKSRDGWKAKCLKLTKFMRKLGNRVRSLERSRDHWKEQTKQLRAELAHQKKRARPQRS